MRHERNRFLPWGKEKNRYRRKAWIAVRHEEIDFCREAKKKSISPWGENRREAWRNRFLPWGKEEIDIAVRRESPWGVKKSIFAVRQRRNRYRREEKSISRRRKIDIAAKKKSISPRRKIDIAAKKKSISPRRKIDYRVEEKFDIAAKEESAVAESSYRTLEHHLRGEQKRKLCLLEIIYGTLQSSKRQKVWSKDLFLMTSSIKGTDRPIPPSTRDLVP